VRRCEIKLSNSQQKLTAWQMTCSCDCNDYGSPCAHLDRARWASGGDYGPRARWRWQHRGLCATNRTGYPVRKLQWRREPRCAFVSKPQSMNTLLGEVEKLLICKDSQGGRSLW